MRACPRSMWRHLVCHIKTSAIRQVRHDLKAVLAWVAEGEDVSVLNRTRPATRICPPLPTEDA